jgi:hypothetical protein
MKLIGTFLLFLLYGLSYGQAFKSNSIGIGFGASNFHIVDEHTSPLLFRGTGIAPCIQFLHKGAKNIHQVEGSYFYDNLSTSADNFNTENFRGKFAYSVGHKVLSGAIFKNRFEFFLGGSFTSFFCKSDYYFDMQNIQARSISSWYWGHSLDLTIRTDYYLSTRDFFNIQLRLPVLSNVSRPTYSPRADYNIEENDWEIKTFGKTVFIPENFTVDISLTYQRQLSASIQLQLNYEFYYLNYDDPARVSMYMNNYRVGFCYIFSSRLK